MPAALGSLTEFMFAQQIPVHVLCGAPVAFLTHDFY
jgi:hypothetical protein